MDNQLNNDILNKKPKNFDSNKLINPDIEVDDEEYDDEDDQIDENINEMDDETIEILNRIRMKNINMEDKVLEYFQEKPETLKNRDTTIKKTSKKTKKNMSLQEFTKSVKSESNQPIKKFTSNRVDQKKQRNDINIVTNKRQFNPRKQPYNFNRKMNVTNIIELSNKSEFPELK
jgi:hypothetical protein